jgi:hypothetical protein
MTKKLPFPAWSWQHSAIRRQFNLENLTTNSTLKQSKSIEISKDLVLILQIYNIYETKGREESPAFLEKKEGRRTYQGWYKAFIITIGAIVMDRDKASPSLRWDHDRGARTTSSFGGTALGVEACGTSSSGGTITAGPYRTGISSSSSRTATVMHCDSEISSSTMCMCFALGTSSSSSLTCVANWSGETGLLQRWWLDSLDGAMAMV